MMPAFFDNEPGLQGYWEHCALAGVPPKKVWGVRDDTGRLVTWSTKKSVAKDLFDAKSENGWEFRLEPPRSKH